jgi:hypothetical protein
MTGALPHHDDAMRQLIIDARDFRLPMPVHAWYGVHAVVRAAGETECDLVVEGRAYPHPSLVNLFLRRELPADIRQYLGAWHEVGHLQTLPIVVGLTLGLSAAMVGSSVTCTPGRCGASRCSGWAVRWRLP